MVTDEVIDGYRRPLLEPGVAEALWAMTAASYDDRLIASARHLQHPCLVIVGTSDRWATTTVVRAARTVVFEECGHLPHEEAPDRAAHAILGFLDELSEATA